jgi:hypothetical protein
VDPKEKSLLAKGYKLRMRSGQKVFCKYEQVLGSRLQGREVCGTADELLAASQAAQQGVQEAQTRQPMVSGK